MQVFNSPEDKIIYDVGHQAYVHKILTNRRSRMSTIRQTGGLSGVNSCSEPADSHLARQSLLLLPLSAAYDCQKRRNFQCAGFTKRDESEYDPFGAGHSSTSVSAALGMAVGRDFKVRHVMEA